MFQISDTGQTKKNILDLYTFSSYIYIVVSLFDPLTLQLLTENDLSSLTIEFKLKEK